MSVRFHSESVHIADNGKSVVVEGIAEEGDILPGMLLTIAFNPSCGMSLPISHVLPADNDRLKLVLDCEDREGAEFVEALNFADESLEVEPPATAQACAGVADFEPISSG